WQPKAPTQTLSPLDFLGSCWKSAGKSRSSCVIHWDTFLVLHMSPWVISSGSAATTIRFTLIWRRGCLSLSTAGEKHPFTLYRDPFGSSQSILFSSVMGCTLQHVAESKTTNS